MYVCYVYSIIRYYSVPWCHLANTAVYSSLCFGSDTPEVDIVGTNLYQRYVDRISATTNQIDNSGDQEDKDEDRRQDVELPACRNVPPSAGFHQQTVNTVVPILVRTGVYRGPPASDSKDRSPSVSSSSSEEEEDDELDFHGHRDFPNNAELRKPQRICDDVATAIDYILNREESNWVWITVFFTASANNTLDVNWCLAEFVYRLLT